MDKQHLTRRLAGEVRAEIARQGITSGTVAETADMARSSLSRKLAGGSDFTLSELAAVCRALGVSLSDMVARAERETAAA